jgi:biotin carboxylase
MKKLMVLGAGFPQAQLLMAARKLGYQTVVCSIPGNYPGFSYADEVAYTDISDPQAVLEAAKAFHVNGVATCCLDTGVRALGYTCQALGFPGLSEAAAICSANKWQMKQAFLAAGVNTAKCVQVTSPAALDEALEQLELPVVVKAVDLQGSKGVYICRTRSQVQDSYALAMELTRQDFCIVEEYIEGHELGAQAFVYQGQIVFVLPHGDNTYMSKTAVPIGHYVPIDASQAVVDAAIDQSKKAIRAIGLDNCAVNIDLIEKNGKIYVIELTGRAGATCLPELVSIYYGVDYYQMIAAMAMGDDPLALFNTRKGKQVANASRMLLSEQSGIVKTIENNVVMDDHIYDLSLIVQPGDTIHKFTNAKDRIGQVIVSGETLADCQKRMEDVLSQIKIEVESL